MKKLILTATVLPLLSLGILNAQIDPYEIMRQMENRDKPKTVESRMRVTRVKIKRGQEKTRERELMRYRKHYSSGRFLSKTITKVAKPIVVKGTGVMTWTDRDGTTSQWLYLPRIRTVKKLEGRDLNSSFLNTDFTFEDLAGRTAGRDSLIVIDSVRIDGYLCYAIEAFPTDESQYGKRIVYLDPEILQFRKIEYFDKDANLVKVLDIPEIEMIDGYLTVLQMTMRNIRKGSRTVIEVLDINYNTGLADDFFSEKILIRLD